MDAGGHDPSTGRPPSGLGAASPAAALAGVPVATWPVTVVGGDGAELTVGAALGPGGARIEQLLDRLGRAARLPAEVAVDVLAKATPAGPLKLPVALVDLSAAVAASAGVEHAWLADLEAQRGVPRDVLVRRGRECELEAALNLAMLLATGGVDDDAASRVASGGRLWLLGGAVAWALLDDPDDPFTAWADLVSYGLWPVGPSAGRLVVWVP